jgi:hypothetical protein
LLAYVIFLLPQQSRLMFVYQIVIYKDKRETVITYHTTASALSL